MYRGKQLTLIGVCLVVALSACAFGPSLSLGDVKSVGLATIPPDVTRLASRAEAQRVVAAFENAKVVESPGDSTPAARIDIVLASGDTVVIWGGAGTPLVAKMRGRQFNLESAELSRILDSVAAEGGSH